MIVYYDFDTGEKRKSPKDGFMKIEVRKDIFESLTTEVKLDYEHYKNGKIVLNGLKYRFNEVNNFVLDCDEMKLIFEMGGKQFVLKAEVYEV